MRPVLLAVLLAVVPCTAAARTVPSPEPSPAAVETSVAQVLAAFAQAPEQPQAYQAAVALHVRLRVFPFVHLTLHGTSTYERPGHYRFTFHGMPIVAKAFSKMTYDLGDPKTWPEQYEIAFAPGASAANPVLRLTPKKAMLVRALDIALDPAHGRILRATWMRGDGGMITLAQTYVPGSDGHDVVTKQDATINLPTMKASLEADYADFQAGALAAAQR